MVVEVVGIEPTAVPRWVTETAHQHTPGYGRSVIGVFSPRVPPKLTALFF
jgi:hypothetical protein